MKNPSMRLQRPTTTVLSLLAVLLSSCILPTSQAEITNIWNGNPGVSATTNWADPLNWINGTTGVSNSLPGIGDDVLFNNNGTVSSLAISPMGSGISNLNTLNVDSIITTNTTIHWLWMGQSNGLFHNIYITNGATLTVAGTNDNGMGVLGDLDSASPPLSITNVLSTMYVGNKDHADATNLDNQADLNSISGGGTLFLNNTNNELQVRDAFEAGGSHSAILDLSGLANFKATLGRIKVAMGEQNSYHLHATGVLFLARTNYLLLTGPSSGELDNLVVGCNPQNSGGSNSFLHLGWTNGIFANTVLIGGRKSDLGVMDFNPNFANPNYSTNQATPTLYMRAQDGVSPISYFGVGDESIGSGAGTSGSGTLNLNGGIFDILANTMIVGKSQTSGGTGSETAILTLGDGKLNVNTLQFCVQVDNKFAGSVTVTANLIGTQVTVNTLLNMGILQIATHPHVLTFNMGADPNGNPAVLTLLGAMSTGANPMIYNITNSIFAMATPQPMVAATVNLYGGTISNAASILATNGLNIYNNGQILGKPVIDMGPNPNFTTSWDLEGVAGGSLVVSNRFQGVGSFTGNLVQAPGATISPGEGTSTGAIAIQSGSPGGNLTLNNGGILQFGLSSSGTGLNDSISVANTNTINGTNTVLLTALGGTLDTSVPYTLISAQKLVGSATNFILGGALAQSRYTFAFDTTSTPNSLKLSVSGTLGSLVWTGDGVANLWDAADAINWLNGGLPDKFYSLDAVTFTDSGSASPSINLLGSLVPGSVKIATTNKNYSFQGIGGLSVSGAFSVTATNPVTFNNSGPNTFVGPVAVNSGGLTLSNSNANTFDNGITIGDGVHTNVTVTLAGNSASTFVNSVFNVQTISINPGNTFAVLNSNANVFNGSSIIFNGTSNATMVFNQPVSTFCDANMSGQGNLIKSGSGQLSLTGNNSGIIVLVNGGILQAGGPSALNLPTSITVASGGTLDTFGQDLVAVPVFAVGTGFQGQGAIVNNGAADTTFTTGALYVATSLQNLTLTGHASIGGIGPWSLDPVQNKGRMDINGGTLTASVTNATSTNAFNLIKTGNNQIGIVNMVVDPNLANIDVQQGLLEFYGTTTSIGNPTNTLTVESGATVDFYSETSVLTKQWVLNGDGSDPTLLDYNGVNVIAGPVTLNGPCFISCVIASRGSPVSLEIIGPIGGTGSLNKPGALQNGEDTLILDGTNTYTGNTVVSAGILALHTNGSIYASPTITIIGGTTIDASGRTDGTLILASGQTLTTSQTGNINGRLVSSPGSTVAPGGSTSLDVLTVASNVTLQGTTSMKLNKASMASDLIASTNANSGIAGKITYGGTLLLTNLQGNLAVGDSFALFSAASYSGSFSSISPASPGAGLAWNTATLTNGIISIIAGSAPPPPLAAKITSARVSGTSLLISGSNGAIGGPFYLLTSTNVALPLTSWAVLATNSFDSSGNFSLTVPYSATNQAQFFVIASP